MRAFDITNGSQKGSIQVSATVPGTGAGSYQAVYSGVSQPVVSFDGDHGNGRFHANDRAALLLLNGVIYCSFAFNTDAPPYHGWILGYSFDGAKFTQKYAFCTTPNGSDGGIWMAGKGLTTDAAGNIYCSVGNGTFDADNASPTQANPYSDDYGMCYLKLSPSLQVESWYAPYDEQSQSDADNDLGNTGLVGIPGTMSLFAGATKFGAGFLLNSASLGHIPADANHETAVQRLNGLSANDDVGQNPVAWDTGTGAAKYVYVWPGSHQLEQFRYDPSVANFNPPTPPVNSSDYPAALYRQSSTLGAGGALGVSSSGNSGAILWAVGYNSTLYALDATDVSKPPLWIGSVGSVGHFQFPTVANGRVYVPTNSSTIAVFGLQPPNGPLPVTLVKYWPRSGLASRMVGGKFQGSQDGVNYTDLVTVTQTPPDGQWSQMPVSNPTAFRFLRYLAPMNAYGNVSEIAFYNGSTQLTGTGFGTSGSWHSQGNDFTKALDGNTSTFFDAPDPGNGDFVGIQQY